MGRLGLGLGVADLYGEEVVFGWNLVGHVGDQPLFVEDLLHVDLE